MQSAFNEEMKLGLMNFSFLSCRQSTKSRASNSSYLIGAGLTSAAATGSRPILSRLPSRKSTKSLRSLRSGYSRMFMPSSRNAGKVNSSLPFQVANQL